MKLEAIEAFLKDYSELSIKHGICFACDRLYVTDRPANGKAPNTKLPDGTFDEDAEFLEVE